MKRMQLIAAALCLVMLATVGTGVVTAKQTENPRQAGASSVYFFDVKATDTHGSGKLMINLAEHKFVFNGKEFDPDTMYYLRYTESGESAVHTFASVMATRSGNVHVEGTWTTSVPLTRELTVSVAATDPPVVTLHTDSILFSTGTIKTQFSAVVTSGTPTHYHLVRVDTNSVLYDGPNQNLGGAYTYWSRADTTYPTVTLTAYDSAGYTCTSSWTPT